MQLQPQTSDERLVRVILREAIALRKQRACDRQDYECFRQDLCVLDLAPEQYALSCGMLAQCLGL